MCTRTSWIWLVLSAWLYTTCGTASEGVRLAEQTEKLRPQKADQTHKDTADQDEAIDRKSGPSLTPGGKVLSDEGFVAWRLFVAVCVGLHRARRRTSRLGDHGVGAAAGNAKRRAGVFEGL